MTQRAVKVEIAFDHTLFYARRSVVWNLQLLGKQAVFTVVWVGGLFAVFTTIPIFKSLPHVLKLQRQPQILIIIIIIITATTIIIIA